MRLTQIKLAGFKSFTDPTTIHVPGQLVAVIGPNGCGKSNVIDAVRWVLGEASAKQLRGESMQDVIFNGAATRRPAPRASVELVFDNSDHSLQGAWGQYAEVAIKRQLTRQGDSGYFINGQAVRRRDITDLFLGTGVGARGYAVIEQGMISRIIEARPEELRAYIEEAAGVSKYKERRRETEARLNDTRDHLQRLADLQTELARQIEKLEKQAGTAERYRQLQQEAEHLSSLLDYVQWQQALADADRADNERQAAEAAQQTVQDNIQAANEHIGRLRQTEAEAQQQHQDLIRQHTLLREQIARLEEQLRARHNQQQRIERERAAAQAQLHKIGQQQAQLHDEVQTVEQEIEQHQLELADLALQAAEYEALLPEQEAAAQAQSQAQASQHDELNRLRRELALKQQQQQHQAGTLANNQSRRQRLEQELAALNLPDQTETDQAEQHAQTAQQQLAECEALLDEHERLAADLNAQAQAAQAAYQDLYRRHLSAQTQQQALEHILRSQQHEDPWIGSSHADAPALWQHLTVSNDWQHATGVILSERIRARALPDDYQPSAQLAGAVWLSRPRPTARKAQPAQALINQIQAAAPFQAALQHWLDGVLCAPDLAYALQHQNELNDRQLWLTPEGHRIDSHSVWLYGQDSSSQLLEQQSRYQTLSDETAALEPQLAAAQSQAEQQQHALSQHQEVGRTLQAQQRQYAAAWQTAQQRAHQLHTRSNQGQLRREHIHAELQQLAEETETAAHNNNILQEDLLLLEEAAAELSQRSQELSGSLQQQQSSLKHTQLALLDTNRRYGLAQIALNRQQHRRQSLTEQLEQLEQQKQDWQERQTELALDAENEADDHGPRAELETLGEHNLSLQERIHAAQSQLDDIRQAGRTAHEHWQTLSADLPRLQTAVQTALLQQQEALITARRHHEQLQQRGADTDALAGQTAAAPKELAATIQSLQQRIQSLGAVNLAALEELAQERERETYYRNQSQDVQAAIALLEEAIAQIDGETKTRFKTTFDAVNEKVQTFFPTLFGGGEAKLHMIGDDLLTAGVSIMARPPGKKNSTIHLLSGGEKALTAMSLVFALFSLNPAPFCLLDEVDAPLDDANTARFCNLVKEMSAQTQFLYISHNRLTMEMAEQLIGVTMQEKGVSRIVAVDIQEAVKMAEAA